MSVGFYSVEDAKQRLGKSEQELRALAKDGQLNMVEDGDAAWFSAADVDEMSGGGDEADVPIDLTMEDDLAIAPPEKPKSEKDITDIPIALEPEEEAPQEDGMSKIRGFSGAGVSSIQGGHDTSKLKRDVIQTGNGATRCRTFHAKLNDASLSYLNSQVNEWIDGDPTIEIKFATSSVGVVEGKHAEPHLIMTVFY